MALTFFAPMTALASCGTTTSQEAPTLANTTKQFITKGTPWKYDNCYYEDVESPNGHPLCVAVSPASKSDTKINIHRAAFQGALTYDCIGINSGFLEGYSNVKTIEVIDDIHSQINFTFGKNAFKGQKNLQQIMLTNGGDILIEDSAFEDCTNLTEISYNISVYFESIGNSAFKGCTNLKWFFKLDDHEPRSFGDSAFEGCKSIKSIEIDRWTQKIGNSVFKDCTALESVKFGGVSAIYLTSIGDSVFEGCTSLKTVDIFEKMTYIGNSVFKNCISLSSFSIPSSVRTIGDHAFSNCGFTSITVPTTVTSIGEYAFSNCSSLETATIPCSIISEYAFSGCSLKEVNLLETVTTIGDFAFAGCACLESIAIPNSVTSIGKHAFSWCEHLQSINLPNRLEVIDDYAFEYCLRLSSVAIPTSLRAINAHAFRDCVSINDVSGEGGGPGLVFAGTRSEWENLPRYDTWHSGTCTTKVQCIDGVADIDRGWRYDDYQYAFDTQTKTATIVNYTNETDQVVHVPSYVINNADGEEYLVNSIGDGVFEGKTSIKKIDMPSIENIGASAFKNCSALTTISIPASVTIIPNSIFQGCSSLQTITIPDSVITIENLAFKDCSSLKTIDIPNTVTSIGKEAFKGCSSLESIELPDTITSIGDYAFRLSGLTSISFPNTIESIGTCAFYQCDSLKEVTFTGNVSCGEYAFSNCSSLETATIGNGITGDHFSGSPLKKIIFIDGATAIGNSAFAGLKTLKTLEIADSVTTIGQYAFSGCEQLESFKSPTNLKTIGDNAFENCKAIKTVTFEESLISIGANAFSGCVNITDTSGPDETPGFQFNGIMAAWLPVPRGEQWHDACPATKIRCSDGDDSLDVVPCPTFEYEFDDDYTATLLSCGEEFAEEVVYIPARVSSQNKWYALDTIYGAAFKGKNTIKQIHIPETMKEIRSRAFSECDSLESINIPNSVQSSTNICEKCASLTTVIVHAPKVGECDYMNCSSLSDVTLENGEVTSIGYGAFYGCTSLQNIKIPSSVLYIGEYAFYNDTNLKRIDLTDFTGTPPTLENSSVFKGIDKDNIRFIVCNNEMKTKFENAEYWKDFKGRFFVEG